MAIRPREDVADPIANGPAEFGVLRAATAEAELAQPAGRDAEKIGGLRIVQICVGIKGWCDRRLREGHGTGAGKKGVQGNTSNRRLGSWAVRGANPLS